MLHVALVEPKIPPNTGNIARTCAAIGARLHLIGPIGFRMDDASLRRAGIDFWDHVDLVRHDSWDAFVQELPLCRLWLFTAHGGTIYTTVSYQDGDCLVFGSETYGLPQSLLDQHRPHVLHVPMPTGHVRSLNLATTVGIAVYEALRQIH
jgi:tRNA (cytidine/uridine-2'-O-)-methyltransferase